MPVPHQDTAETVVSAIALTSNERQSEWRQTEESKSLARQERIKVDLEESAELSAAIKLKWEAVQKLSTWLL